MPIDWDKFEKRLDKIIDKAGNKTDDKLASKVSSITRMTNEEIMELFPKPPDIEKLTKLMKIVKSAEDRNNKINQLVENSEEFAGIVLTLLGKLA